MTEKLTCLTSSLSSLPLLAPPSPGHILPHSQVWNELLAVCGIMLTLHPAQHARWPGTHHSKNLRQDEKFSQLIHIFPNGEVVF